jgi:hypothetical protein
MIVLDLKSQMKWMAGEEGEIEYQLRICERKDPGDTAFIQGRRTNPQN